MACAASLSILLALPGATAQARIITAFKPSSVIELGPGVSYRVGTMRTDGGIQSVRVATIDPSNPVVRVAPCSPMTASWVVSCPAG